MSKIMGFLKENLMKFITNLKCGAYSVSQTYYVAIFKNNLKRWTFAQRFWFCSSDHWFVFIQNFQLQCSIFGSLKVLSQISKMFCQDTRCKRKDPVIWIIPLIENSAKSKFKLIISAFSLCASIFRFIFLSAKCRSDAIEKVRNFKENHLSMQRLSSLIRI